MKMFCPTFLMLVTWNVFNCYNHEAHQELVSNHFKSIQGDHPVPTQHFSDWEKKTIFSPQDVCFYIEYKTFMWNTFNVHQYSITIKYRMLDRLLRRSAQPRSSVRVGSPSWLPLVGHNLLLGEDPAPDLLRSLTREFWPVRIDRVWGAGTAIQSVSPWALINIFQTLKVSILTLFRSFSWQAELELDWPRSEMIRRRAVRPSMSSLRVFSGPPIGLNSSYTVRILRNHEFQWVH